MDYNKAKELLEKYGQEQLLRYYDELNDDRKASLLKQIEGIDFSLLDLIKENSEAKKGVITPLDSAVTIEDIEKNKEKYTNIGISAIKRRKGRSTSFSRWYGYKTWFRQAKGNVQYRTY